MLASMSRKGNCWDNAPSESFFNSLKNERLHDSHYETRADARADVFDYIEVFYNRSRRHSSLGFVSPMSLRSMSEKAVRAQVGGVNAAAWCPKNRRKVKPASQPVDELRTKYLRALTTK